MTDASKQSKDSPQKKVGQAFPQEVLDVTGGELLEFFEQLDPEACCPVCKHDISIMAAIKYDEETGQKEFLEQPAIVGMPLHEYPETGATYKTPCFVTSCQKCGHLNYFMVNPVVKWKKSHDNKG
ncbi:hypothetical protein M8009_00575 [Halomonas sp. ATCH28]|uniref:Uncharacterized protein n=1 Tax=Halomonas gemina TaxID=2945105 RepID=A0ABT0SWC8_9GAMM|nr:hypothetical protein [Halomonas gemina]MCL7938797.1 hypothetical protein [Halomonas gemina]